MSSKNIISSTEARQKFAEILKDVEKTGAFYTFTVNGRAKAVMMSPDEFEGWQETLDIMANDPGLLKRIKKAEKQFERGEYVTLEQLEAELGITEKQSSKK